MIVINRLDVKSFVTEPAQFDVSIYWSYFENLCPVEIGLQQDTLIK